MYGFTSVAQSHSRHRHEADNSERKTLKLALGRELANGHTELSKAGDRVFYPALDGIRAIAFLLVFLQHYYSVPWGWSGVNIFFVLSGFLITGILFDSRNEPFRVRNFYIRRTLRIFPLYYGVFLVLLLLDPLFHWHWSVDWFWWPLYLGNFLRFVSPSVLTSGSALQFAAFGWLNPSHGPQIRIYLGHFWSLCVEEQFYLFWPWIIFWVRSRRSLIWLCSAVVIFVPLLRVLVQNTAPDWMLQMTLLYTATPFQLDALLLGGLVALLLRGPHRKRVFEIGSIIALYSSIAALFVLVAGIAHAYPNWRAGYSYPSWKYTWGLTGINLIAAGTILSALQPSSLIYRVLSLRPLRWMGRISYGAYVFHDIFHSIYLYLVTAVGAHCKFVARNTEQMVVLVGLTCTLAISWLSFRFFESGFLKLKERWTVIPETDRASAQ